jgi:toxin ParE2
LRNPAAGSESLLALNQTFEVLDEASEEVDAATRWYARRSWSAAAGFVAAYESALSQIERMPYAWPPYRWNTRRFLLHRYPYHVVYWVDPDRVVVIAVAHMSRRPDYWRDRLDAL